MTGRLPSWTVRGVLLVLVAGGFGASSTGAGVAGPGWGSWEGRRGADLVASAIPGPGARSVEERVRRVVKLTGTPYEADATALASVTCRGCTGDATTLQVVRVEGSRAGIVDNVAAAWSSCRGCRATAVSVQVVVVNGRPDVRANNRALTVNAACDRCHSAAAAFQLVVAGPGAGWLTKAERRALWRWAAEQSALLREPAGSGPPTARGGNLKAGALRGLGDLVNGALGTRTVQGKAVVRLR